MFDDDLEGHEGVRRGSGAEVCGEGAQTMGSAGQHSKQRHQDGVG